MQAKNISRGEAIAIAIAPLQSNQVERRTSFISSLHWIDPS